MEKPSLDEVFDYAKFMIDFHIRKKAMNCPVEHREEMQQKAFERILKSYQRLDAEKGWKSFVYKHCRGAIMDYQKFGEGFGEEKWSVQHNKKKKSTRVHMESDGERCSLDNLLNSEEAIKNQLFNLIDEDRINIRWDIVEIMAAQDQIIHVFAKFLRGFSHIELAEFFGLSRTRIFQLIDLFIKRFDDPELNENVWFMQTCYAFGLCRRFGMPEEDQFMKFNMHYTMKVNLDAKEPIKVKEFKQLTFGEL